MSSDGWVGVDLDGTLAHYDKWRGPEHVGEPIEKMVRVVKDLLAAGVEVRIFTARVSDGDPTTELHIRKWCREHLGQTLPVTCTKDFQMRCLFDDRAVAVERNTGRILGGELPF